MITYSIRARALATCLSALAGYVDAVGFVHLGGFFVSFMSGNSTRLGVGLVHGPSDGAIAAGLIATFVSGVILGSLTGHLAGVRRRPAVVALVAGLLASAAGFGAAGEPVLAAIAMALAMGAENAVFEMEGQVHIGLTYMTGTLVKLGQGITAALLGGDRFGWMPYLFLWLGLAAGGLAGAVTYSVLDIGALWIAAGVAAVLAVAAGTIDPDRLGSVPNRGSASQRGSDC